MVYLTLITNKKELHNLKELIEPIWDFFDGLIVCYDSVEKPVNDECFEYLESRKKNGEILFRPWTNDHDLQMNVFLRQGPLKENDWFVIRDSSERFNPEWCKDIKAFLNSMTLSNIKSIYNYGKGFAFQWNDGMIFQGSPHWGLVGGLHNAIDIKEFHDESKKEWTWRVKNGDDLKGRPLHHKIDHEAKYFWIYGRSNHALLKLEHDIDEFQRVETIRQIVRREASMKGFSTSNLEGLKEYMEYFKENNFNNFKVFINSHRTWKNFFRWHFLKEDFNEIESNEFDWKLQ